MPLFFDQNATHQENCAAMQALPAAAIRCGSQQLLADLLNMEKQAQQRWGAAKRTQVDYTATSNTPRTVVVRIPYGSLDALNWGEQGIIHQSHNFHTLAPIQTNAQGVVKPLKNFGGFNWRAGVDCRWLLTHAQADIKGAIRGPRAPAFGSLSPDEAVRWVVNLPESVGLVDSAGNPMNAVHLSFEIFADGPDFVLAVHGTADRSGRLRASNFGIQHTNDLAVWSGVVSGQPVPFFCLSISAAKLATLPLVQRWEFVADMEIPAAAALPPQLPTAQDLFSSLSSAQFRIHSFDPLDTSATPVHPDEVLCFWFFLSPPGEPVVEILNFRHPSLLPATNFDFSAMNLRWDAQFLSNAAKGCVVSRHPGGTPIDNLASAGAGDCFFFHLG